MLEGVLEDVIWRSRGEGGGLGGRGGGRQESVQESVRRRLEGVPKCARNVPPPPPVNTGKPIKYAANKIIEI